MARSNRRTSTNCRISEGKKKPHNLALADAEILAMTALEETFDPAAIITWAFKPNAWRIPRDWAEFS